MNALDSLRNITSHVSILEDDVAERILGDAGILYLLNQHPLAVPWLWATANNELPRVFVAGMRISGFPNLAENGLVAHIFPRSHFTKADVDHFMADAIKGICGPDTTIEMTWAPARRN